MSETVNVPPTVIGAVGLGICGGVCGIVVMGVRMGILKGEPTITALLILLLLGGLFSLVGFIVGGIAGGVWGLFGHTPQISAQVTLVVVMTGVVKGALILGGIGLFLGACVSLFVYINLSNSYVHAREASDMALIVLVLATVPAFIIGAIGGGVWAAGYRIIS